jgi:hypothetical protein
LKPGTQFFEIKNSKMLEIEKFRYIKIIVNETYGGSRTYINQIFFFDDLSGNTSTMYSIKATQVSRKAARSESHSQVSILANIDDEEEEVTKIRFEPEPPIERKHFKREETEGDEDENTISKVSKSKSKSKSQSKNNKYSKNKYNSAKEQHNDNNDNDDESDNTANDMEYDPHTHLDDKKLKQIENILKKKIKEKITKNKKNLSKNFSEILAKNSPVNDDEEDNSNEEMEEIIPKSKKKPPINNRPIGKKEEYISPVRHYTPPGSEDSPPVPVKNKKITNFKPVTIPIDNEYKKLEGQLKEMEDHLKSMDVELKYDSKLYGGLGHSKSFSFIKGETSSNPFINNKSPIRQNKNYNYNDNHRGKKTNDLANYLFEDNKGNKGNYNDNYNNSDNDYDNVQFNNQTNNFKGGLGLSSYPHQTDMNEVRILKIEDKLNHFEKELNDMKHHFEKLILSIDKLVEGGGGSFNYLGGGGNNYKNFQNDEISPVNLILNECHKMINERMSQVASKGAFCNNCNCTNPKNTKNNNYTKKSSIQNSIDGNDMYGGYNNMNDDGYNNANTNVNIGSGNNNNNNNINNSFEFENSNINF